MRSSPRVLVFVLLAVLASAEGQASCPIQATATYDPATADVTTLVSSTGGCGEKLIYRSKDGGPWTLAGSCGIGPDLCELQLMESVACLAEGQHTWRYQATCGKEAPPPTYCEADTPGFADTSFTIGPRTAGITNVQVDPNNSFRFSYNFEDAGTYSQAAADILPAKGFAGRSYWINLGFPYGAEGTTDWHSVWEPEAELVQIRPYGCDLPLEPVVAALYREKNCDPCSPGAFTGDPIRVAYGNMRYQERDPLPDPFGILAQRNGRRSGSGCGPGGVECAGGAQSHRRA